MMPLALLAGGSAQRIRPLSEKIPKALIEINGRPFIDYQLELLGSQGIEKVVLCLGYLGEIIQEYLGDGKRYGLQLQYSYDGDKPLGTGGAIKKALPLLDERFFLLYGDSYLPIDFKSVEMAFIHSEKRCLMTVYRNKGLWDTSNVAYVAGKSQDTFGDVACYNKNMPTSDMNYIDYGLSCLLSSEISNEKNDFFDLSDFFTRLSSGGQLAGYEVTERFYEIGSFSGIDDFSCFIKGKRFDCLSRIY
ncbi:MAG: NTP transferase domain-containing protein [Synergistaceae bacterium]|jgi:NDP-sugar pyrophosphorylase family protein|nr:NTP transferase domain-containing protein [Synergistaceae bacterium]